MLDMERGRVAAGRVLAVACSGTLLAFLDATLVSLRFPSIRASVPESSIGAPSWVPHAHDDVPELRGHPVPGR
ncbi:MAG: hypothetical protein ABI807_16165 [Sporichthyaceae bacterium]